MAEIIEFETDRLRLRQWRKTDWPEFAKLNADPEVMRYFPKPLSTEESNAMADKIYNLISERGWGMWAAEEVKQRKFMGFVGLHIPAQELPFTPCVEIGWRLAKEFWGHGYATEAGRATLQVAFRELELSQVVSFTSMSNTKSQAVMKRLNMVNTGNNFEHPDVPVGNPLREHVLFKINKLEWAEKHNNSVAVMYLADKTI